LFERATLNFENGRNLVIEAPGNNHENIYVQAVSLNGNNLDRNYIRHGELQKGGKLVFRMGPEPEKTRGIDERSFPFSMSTSK
jgi:putative alpha-1,2-mannosidase